MVMVNPQIIELLFLDSAVMHIIFPLKNQNKLSEVPEEV